MTDRPADATDPASRLSLLVGRGAAWLFLVAVVISTYEVVMRYAFAAPSTWIHETTTTLCAVAFALGGAWCMVRREHIRITWLPDRSGPLGRHVVEVVALALGLFYLGGLAYGVGADAWGSLWRFDFQGRWTPELTPGPPHWPLPTLIKVSLFGGTVLFALVCLVQLVRALAGRPIER